MILSVLLSTVHPTQSTKSNKYAGNSSWVNDWYGVVLCGLLSEKERTKFSGPWRSTLEFYHENNGGTLNSFGRKSNISKFQLLHGILVARVADVLEGLSVPPRHRGRTTIDLPRTVLMCMKKLLEITGKAQEKDQHEDLIAHWILGALG